MKNLISILLMSVSLVVGCSRPAFSNNVPSDHLVMAIVLDCSDVGYTTWKQSLILVRQAISLLRNDDDLILITAQQGQNLIVINCRIDPNNSVQQITLNQKLMSLSYEWWSRARLDGALETAFGELGNHLSGRKACLLISDGCYSDSETVSIRYAAALFKRTNIPLLMTVSSSANQNLLLAGNLGELEIAVIDQVDLTSWVDRIRPRTVSKISETQAPTAPSIVKPATVEPTSAILKQPKQQVLIPPPSATPMPEQNLQVANTPAQAKTPPEDQNKKLLVSPLPTVPAHSDKNTPSLKPQLQPASKPKERQRMIGLALFAILLLVISLILVAVARAQSALSLSNIDHPAEENSQCIEHLIATEESQRYDLGELTSISDFVFGSKTSSPVLLSGDNILPEEFKVSKTGHGFMLKNLSDVVLRINLMPLEPGRKTDVMLPVTVTSEKGYSLGLFCEPIEENNKEGETEHDKESMQIVSSKNS
jgi:hypothetical protein